MTVFAAADVLWQFCCWKFLTTCVSGTFLPIKIFRCRGPAQCCTMLSADRGGRHEGRASENAGADREILPLRRTVTAVSRDLRVRRYERRISGRAVPLRLRQ